MEASVAPLAMIFNETTKIALGAVVTRGRLYGLDQDPRRLSNEIGKG
jgi:hypothetical protein